MPRLWGTNDGMAQLRALGLQKGELLESCLALPLRHFPGLTFRTKPSASSQAEASTAMISASALDTLSSTSLSARAAQSSTTLTQSVVLSRTAMASRAEFLWWALPLKDGIRRLEGGEWESIKIPQGNSAYVPNQTQRASLLTRPRPHSYRKANGTQNRARELEKQRKATIDASKDMHEPSETKIRQ
jgi:hypothetical protein